MSSIKKHKFSEFCDTCGSRHRSVFCSLESDHLDLFNQAKSCLSFKKGQVIFTEGSHPLGIFCVNKGKVKLSQSGQEGKDQILRMAREGDVLGYRALLVAERYNASAVALDDSDVCFIPRETFFAALQGSRGLSLEFIRLLASELGKAEDTITGIAQKPVRERLAEALLFLKETYGLEADEATIDVTLSREDIANLVGTATETAIRLLSEFKNDGILMFVGKKIKILDLAALIRTANIYN